MTHPAMLPTMNIGETIRNYRLQKGMSQGDIEKRTGLLRCYLSRVENGHTIPSLDTLSKIAGAMELPLSQFFAEPGHSNGSKGLPQLSDDEVRFLSQIRRYATTLNDSDRKLVLAMVKKMASNATSKPLALSFTARKSLDRNLRTPSTRRACHAPAYFRTIPFVSDRYLALALRTRPTLAAEIPVTIDEELNVLDTQLRRLKIEYEIFFSNPQKASAH